MHVCFLCHQEYPETFVTAINEYTQTLADLGVDVSVIAGRNTTEQPTFERIKGVDVYRIDADTTTAVSIGPTVFGYRGLRKIDELCEQEEVDILHMRAFPNLGLILRTVPWLDSPPVTIADARGTAISNKFFDYISRVGIRAQRTLVDEMITVDEKVASNVLGEDSDVNILPLGADFEKFRPGDNKSLREQWGVGPDDVVLGYTGILYPTRDLDRLVRSFSRLVTKHPQSTLIIVGDGDARSGLEQLVTELGIEESVIFTGEVPFEDVPEYLRAFDIGLAYIRDSVQYRDQPPLKTVEYLASGLPVVGTDTPGNKRFLTDGENGRLTPDDIEAYADALAELVDSAEEREQYSSRARDSVSKFDYRSIVENELLPIYQEALQDMD